MTPTRERSAARGRSPRRKAPPPRRSTPATTAARAFPQIESGSPKQRVVLALVRARVNVQGALQGLMTANAERPLRPGGWSTREHVLHLGTRDLEATRSLPAAARGEPPAWSEGDRSATDRLHSAWVDRERHRSWEEAQRLLLTAREDLMAAIDDVWAEPAAAWESGHPLAAMLLALAENDRHHAELIKRWRIEHGV
jgi:hypothetical protein